VWVDVANQNYVSNASIKFAVDKAWMSTNNIDPNTVALYRFKDGTWSKMETAKASEDAAKVYYIAKVPSFSPFAITGEKMGAATATSTPTATTTPTATPTPTATATPVTATPTPAKGAVGFDLLPAVLAIAALAMLLRRNCDP
jgi:hypothetical protein